MRTTVTAFALFMALAVVSTAWAQTPTDPAPSGQTRIEIPTIELAKDPVVAMYLSATLPGLGQI